MDFPLKMKPLLSWTPVQYIKENGMLKQAPQAPVEKVNTLLQESMRSYKNCKTNQLQNAGPLLSICCCMQAVI